MDATPHRGALYCLDSDLSVRKMVENVSISNGLEWSPDGKTMYYIDTATMEIAAFDYDAATGSIGHRRPFIRIPDGQGSPDGMTIDAEGNLWVAHWDGFQVTRRDPSTGQMLSAIAVPAPLVTSCAFGGEQLDELFITTARIGLDDAALARYPLSGAVFCVKPGVKGVVANSFAG